MADEIITGYRLDAQGWIAGAQQIEKGTDELIKDNKQLETSFGEVNKTTAKAFSTDGVKQFNKEAKKALAETNKAASDTSKSVSKGAKEFLQQQKLQQQELEKSKKGFVAMRQELKAVQGQLATLASQGKEGTKEFKILSARAGELKDQMADLGDAINLQANSPIENLTGSLGNARQALFNLDFEGATRAFGIAGGQLKKISFKDLLSGIQDTVIGFGKLAGAIITSPLFLITGTVALIVASIVNWGDSMEEIAARNDKAVDRINAKLETTTSAFDRQIKVLQALGKDTSKIEDDRLRAIIKSSNEALKVRKKELNDLGDIKEFESNLLNSVASAQIKRADELRKSITDLEEQKNDAISEIQATTGARQTEADKKRKEEEIERQKKANEAYKKLLDDRLQLGIKKFNEAVDRARFEEQQKEQQDIIDANKKIDEIIASALPKRKEALTQLEKDLLPIRRDNLKKTLDDETISFEARQSALEEALEKQLISEQEFTDASKKLTEDRIADRKKEFDARVQLGNDLLATTQNFAQIAAELGMQNAEGQQALALFGIGLSLAQSLGNAVLAATEAGVFTGAAAPFTIVAFIAQLTAAVSGAFAQSLALVNKPIPQFYAGGFVGDGGKFEPAGIVHGGEWVTTKEDTNRYWDELNAIHDGTFDDLLMYKYIGPALENAVSGFKESQNKSFAENIANSMMMNAMFKDGNILNALMKTNNDEGKRHKQLVQAIKKAAPRTTYRKK